MGECIRLTDSNFRQEVLESNLPVFVEFWGSWCPPCQMVDPIMNELAEQLDGTIKVGKLNIDQNPATRAKLNVGGAPTFIVYRNGKILGRAIGARSKKQLLKMIDDALESESETQNPKHID